MTEAELHRLATWAEIGLAGAAFVALIFVTAPYGRHDRAGWGPRIPNSLGWVVMEAPTVVLFPAIYLGGRHAFDTVPLVLASAWMVHYVHRTFVFPMRVRTRGKGVALAIVAMGFAFNVLNAYVVGRWISHLGDYDTSWLLDPRFAVGMLVMAAGFAINIKADGMLIALRRPGETSYALPRGWLFDSVSCPNYLGEIIEWTGFAIALWSLPGLAFAVFTAANVGPRAMANHRWYRATFPDYPPERRALIPFVI
jgi:hypothetical protein